MTTPHVPHCVRSHAACSKNGSKGLAHYAFSAHELHMRMLSAEHKLVLITTNASQFTCCCCCCCTCCCSRYSPSMCRPTGVNCSGSSCSSCCSSCIGMNLPHSTSASANTTGPSHVALKAQPNTWQVASSYGKMNSCCRLLLLSCKDTLISSCSSRTAVSAYSSPCRRHQRCSGTSGERWMPAGPQGAAPAAVRFHKVDGLPTAGCTCRCIGCSTAACHRRMLCSPAAVLTELHVLLHRCSVMATFTTFRRLIAWIYTLIHVV
ncbi:hypothetical protein COO60DRAFT_300357 [Scenedesmus sp. NREL 46B-D3]|nr:hypothetical protein COO60DRAFT_300357 [Scenedesmus sp. NREL 46B-D3]